MEMDMTEISTEMFTYIKESKTLVCDDSDLRNYNPIDMVHRGFTMVSHHTFNRKKFVFIERVTDNEGDVLYWKYQEDRGPLIVKIFND